MRKSLLIAIALIALLSQRTSAQLYSVGGPNATAGGGGTCVQTGIADLTNSCNNIYLLTGVLK